MHQVSTEGTGDVRAMSKGTVQQIDQFRIIRELGRGGMGVVYLAEERAVNRILALRSRKATRL